MNFLEFFAIAEQDRDILNPIGPEKLEKVAAYAGLRDGLSVLDVGSGKGALLRQWARNWDIRGVGLELNPAFVQQARELTQAAGLTEKLSFWEGKALDFPVKVAGYDVVVCLGATFAIGTFSEAVAWMGAQ
ncbi:SAM-dependent methyltransferase [Deinococcus fonticola]|uniref:SAM-dependent methyltransferase n=1 Tax=Deinococcus fonticola TaxID=2528713 RepID=UPI00143130BB|nr:class I SAM-dependent methyltransferase [Deinococcus fonticola]